MDVLSSKGLLFRLLPSSSSLRPASHLRRFRQQVFLLSGNPATRPVTRRFFTRKLSAYAQSSGTIASHGGWADGGDGCDWEELYDSCMSCEMDILGDYLLFINKDIRMNITLFFLGFMSALALSRFKSSLLSVFPVCVFLFSAGFCLGYVRHDSGEDAKAEIRKIFKSQVGVESISSEKTASLQYMLNKLEMMVCDLENATKEENVSHLGIFIESIRSVKLAIEASMLPDSELILSDGPLNENKIKEVHSHQKLSRRRIKQFFVGDNVIQFLVDMVQRNFLSSKSSKNNLFYGSPMHDGQTAMEMLKKNVDGRVMTSERVNGMQPSITKGNLIGSNNGGIMRTDVEGHYSFQIHENEKEGCSGSVPGAFHYSGGSSSPGPKVLNPVYNLEFTTPFQKNDTKYENGKVLEHLSQNFKNFPTNNENFGDNHETELSALRGRVQSFRGPNRKNSGRHLSVGFHKGLKTAAQQEHYNNPRVPKTSNLSNNRLKAKATLLEAETESLGYEFNLENSLKFKDQPNMVNKEAAVDSLLAREEENRFMDCFDEGVLLLKEAKECFINELDEEVVARILTRSAELLSRATEMKPTSVFALGQFGNTLLLHGRLKLKISRKLRDVLSSNDPLFHQKNDREKIIFDLSDVCEECEELLIEAGRKYRMAVSIDNNDVRSLYNWGLALFFRAQLIADIGPDAAYDADKVYLASIDKFNAMLARSNAYATSALFRWGMVLQQRSLLRPIGSKERSKLLIQAKRLFEDALSIDSDYSQAREALLDCIEELS